MAVTFDVHKNFAGTTVVTVPTPASSGTTLVVLDGTVFPSPATTNYNITIWPANTAPTPTNAEIVRVTALSTNTLTITRTQESTPARAITVGDNVALTITAKALTDIEAILTSGVTDFLTVQVFS